MKSDDIPEINIVVKSQPVTAVSRKLRVRWSVDPVEELGAFHSGGLFAGIVEVNGKVYINEVYKEKYKDWNLPIIRIKCKIKKKDK